MLASLLKLFVLRPLFTLAVFGIPIVVLIVVGLITIALLKLVLFVILPVVVVVWVLRRLFGSPDPG